MMRLLEFDNGDEYRGELRERVPHGNGVKKYFSIVSKTIFTEEEQHYNVEHQISVDLDVPYYDGNWNKGIKTGYGHEMKENGDTYTGLWKDDLYHGNGTYTFKDSGDIYEGEFVQGIQHGYAKYTCKDIGTIYEGEWRNGLRVIKYNNGDDYTGDIKVDYEGKPWLFYGRNIPHGKGILTKIDGSVYDGEFLNGKYHGKGIMHFKSGLVYDGEWCDGKENGYGILYELDGTIYNGEWYDGLQHGDGEYLYASGQIFRGLFENGYKHGKGIFYDTDGTILKAKWCNGNLAIDVNDNIKDLENGILAYKAPPGFVFEGIDFG